MNVTTVRATPDPDRLVAQCARGDYTVDFIGETPYDQLVESITIDEDDIAQVVEIDELDWTESDVDVPEDAPEELCLDTKTHTLLERLLRRGHWGPFEHSQITLAVEGMSRSCMAQLTRHRHASFDVQSMRYVDFSEKEALFVDPKSITDPNHATRGHGNIDLDDIDTWNDRYSELTSDAMSFYGGAVDAGVPEEDARFGLPIGTTVNLSVSLNARAIMHVLNLRSTGEAQWEIRQLSKNVRNAFADWMPITAELWSEHGPVPESP
jgi:thymidylate synthase, flavin-dependent